MNNLKETRVKKGIKQETVASFLNMTRQNYARIESGQQKLTDEILIKLADYFQVSIDYLLDYHTEPTSGGFNVEAYMRDHPDAVKIDLGEVDVETNSLLNGLGIDIDAVKKSAGKRTDLKLNEQQLNFLKIALESMISGFADENKKKDK